MLRLAFQPPTLSSQVELLPPADTNAERVAARLAGLATLRAEPARRMCRKLLDRADGVLRRRGVLLEWEVTPDGHRLSWQEGRRDHRILLPPDAPPPRRVVLLPPGSFRRRVWAVTGDAELLEVAAVHGSSRRLRLMDGDAKTLCRVCVDCAITGEARHDGTLPRQSRVRVIPVKGYEALAARVVARLSRQPGWRACSGSIFDDLIRCSGGHGEASASGRPRSEGENPAGALGDLLRSMDMHRKAVDPAGDPEALHDFRVCLRRLRTLLGQGASTGKASRLRAGLKWLGRVSGTARDLDVQARDLERAFREQCPGERASRRYVAARVEASRLDAHRNLRDAFESKRHARVRRTLRSGLGATPPSGKEGVGRSGVLPKAEARIPKLYRTALRQGDGLDQDAPDECFHRLRKTIKKLRYLLESLPAQGADEGRDTTIKSLKGMQTTLGDLNDVCVRRALLDGLRTETAAHPGRPEGALRCLDTLLDHCKERRSVLKARVMQHFEKLCTTRARRELLGSGSPKEDPSR